MVCTSFAIASRSATPKDRQVLLPAMLVAMLSATILAAADLPAQTAPTPTAAVTSEVARLQIDLGIHSAPARRLAAAPHRNRIVTASDDKTARIWDLTSGDLLHVLRPHVGSGEIGRLYGAAIHPQEEIVAIGGATGSGSLRHRILLFSTATGRFLREFDARGGDIKHLAWSSDGSLLFAAYAGENAVRAFDASGAPVFERRLQAPCYGLAVSMTGTTAATALDGSILLLEASAGRVSATRLFKSRRKDVVGAAFSPDGRRLLVGFVAQETPPELFDVRSGASLGPIAVPAVRIGHFMSVAWSADGSVIAAAGSARDTDHRHDIFFLDARNGRFIGRRTVATDTILHLEPLTGRSFAYASFDGSWGTASPEAIHLRGESFRGPDFLLVSPDAHIVQWSLGGGQRHASFNFADRIVRFGEEKRMGTRSPLGSKEDGRSKGARSLQLMGSTVRLADDEFSRTVVYLEDKRAALLGTTQRLMRLERSARVRWEVRTGAEVKSIGTSSDGMLAVTALSDGTIRWWRAQDGVLLLSLLVTPEGRWVAWTEAGYFDASAGADRLAGWAVNRHDAPTADFFSLSRFRDRFNRPDLIDSVLRGRQPAIAQAAPALPPVLESTAQPTVKQQGSELTIPYTVRPGAAGDVAVEVRVDGRPLPEAKVVQQAASGQITGAAQVPAVPAGSLVQLVARDSNGVSEPIGFVLEKQSPPPAADVAMVVRPSTLANAASPSSAQGPPGASAPDTLAAVAAPAARPPAEQVAKRPAARLVVLAIGISRYQKPEYQLGLAAKDAADFADVMKRQAGSLYSDVVVRTLIDERASRTSIIDHLHWLSESVGPRDIGVMFFAGHGLNAADGQYYFLPQDADHEQLTLTAVPEEEIRRALGRLRGKALLFVDTCFGGSALSRAGSSEIARMANNLSAAENGVVVFASSSGRQLSEENDAWGNGAFTKAVLSGLSGKADLTGTGRVTFKGLDFYVSEEVRKLTDGRQTPVTISPTGVPDFPLVITTS